MLILLFFLFLCCTFSFENKNISTIIISKNNIHSNIHQKKIIKDNSLKTLILNSTNFILLKGVIDKKTTNSFMYQLNLLPKKKNIYLYIDSPGGSVEDGNKILNEVQKYKIKCITERAYSMAFAIFQGCSKRYIIPYAKLMQHQMSFGIKDEKAKIESYIEFINQIEDELILLQSSKIGMSTKEFKDKTYNEWWIFGESNIKQNCADKIIQIKCSKQLTSYNYTISEKYYDYVYSKCPLVGHYIEKIKKETKESNSIFDILFE